MEFLDKEGVVELKEHLEKEFKDEGAVTKAKIEKELNDIASLIINGLGLHVTKVPTEDGDIYYLHNHTTLEESDTQYVFGANGFVVSTDYGQTWNAGFDAQGNAVVNSLSAIIIKALQIYGSYIEGAELLFGEADGYNVAVQKYDDDYRHGVKFTGNGSILMNAYNLIMSSVNDSCKLTISGSSKREYYKAGTKNLGYENHEFYADEGGYHTIKEISLNDYVDAAERMGFKMHVQHDDQSPAFGEDTIRLVNDFAGDQQEIYMRHAEGDDINSVNLIRILNNAPAGGYSRAYFNGNELTISSQDATESYVNSVTIDGDTGISMTTQNGSISVTDSNGDTTDLFAAMKLLPTYYRLSGNSSVRFDINSGQYMAVLFAQRYSASQTGAICLLEQYTANYTTFGSLGAITVTKGTGRQFTVSNTSSANVELIGLCGHFTAISV